MIYYVGDMELEVVSTLFCGKVNRVEICRNRRSAIQTLYTALVVHDREYARKMLQVMERNEYRTKEFALMCYAQGEQLIFTVPYREERKFSAFAKGQITSPRVGERICINLVMECLSSELPWPLLYLILEQDGVQIALDNSIYFSLCLDLSTLNLDCTQRSCVSSCARLLMEVLEVSIAGNQRKKLQSQQIIYKKITKNAYSGFPELYYDIKLTALPDEKTKLMPRIKGIWHRNKDRMFRVLLVISMLLVLVALIALVTQLIFGELPWLRLFQNTFDIIGTENLHQGGHV